VDYLIFDLARILRKSGICVSTCEIADSIQVLNLLKTNKLNKYAVYNLLNATIVKTEWGARYIQQLVELFLEPDPEIATDHTGVLSPQNFSSWEAGYGETGSGQTQSGASIALLTETVLKKDIDLIYAIVKRHKLSLDLYCENQSEAVTGFKLQSGWFQVSDTIEEYLKQGKLTPAAYQNAQESLNQWENFLVEEFERQQATIMSRDYLSRLLQQHNPKCLNFLDVADADLALMSRELHKLARRLAVKKGRRSKAAQHGKINLSKSIGHAMQTGGIPLKLIKLVRKPAKPDICLLCDMSNSVRKFSYFMLLFVYALQKQYSTIRSFLFVDQLLEVTDYFRDQDIDSVFRKISSLKGFNLSGFSHYGNVIHQFTTHHLGVLHKNTTVLILGDAKNNWNTVDGSEVLYKIREQAKALYWLNPVKQELWQQSDCIIEKYRPSCNGVYPCATIEQLERFVTAVF
jgi:uncharacterized protein with von Willebrand factor type A (vWA) domain